MKVAHVQSHPNGPRLYIGSCRLHHGTTGVLLAAAGIAARRPLLGLVGAALAIHDAHDFRVWFTIERFDAKTVITLDTDPAT